VGDDFTVSAEVTKIDSIDDMIKEAKSLAKIDKHILIKVPMTEKGMVVVKELSKQNIKCNVTLVFSPLQALLAAKAGAWCVSPFMGRIDDVGGDGLNLIKEIRTIFDNYNFNTKILAASTRSNIHVTECALIGADIVTMPKKIFDNMFNHPLTDKGIKKFNEDWKKYEKKLKSKNKNK
jgi:transaldolase